MAFFLTKKQGKIIAAILIFIAIGLFFFLAERAFT